MYDSSDRCDSGQRYDSDSGLCVCTGNTVADEHGCVACAENEEAKNDVCVCVEGYQRTGATCEFVPVALGAACETDAECSDATYSTCHLPEGKGGYCTNAGCDTSNDCQGGYACNTADDPSFCEQPPTGAGQACASNEECAGTDATYCEVFNTHVCYVRGCSLTENDCFSGYECCDLAAKSGGLVQEQICVKAGTCDP